MRYFHVYLIVVDPMITAAGATLPSHHTTDCIASLQWRHYERDGVSSHCRLDCLLNRLFRRTSKKSYASLAFVVWPVSGEFPWQRSSNKENTSIWWRHHVIPWWRQGMEMCSALLVNYEGNPPVSGKFSSQRASCGEPCCFLCCLPEDGRSCRKGRRWRETSLLRSPTYLSFDLEL